MEVHVARYNMLCHVVSSLLLDPSHSFAAQILQSYSLVEFVEQLFLLELTKQLFEHQSFLLTYEQDHEVLINYDLLKKIFVSCCCLAQIY